MEKFVNRAFYIGAIAELRIARILPITVEDGYPEWKLEGLPVESSAA
jgi:hypothetical protein